MIHSDEDDEFDRIARENRLKSSGMECCTYDCIQGRDCPIRKARANPPQRKPLTDEDLRKLADKHLFYQPEGYEVSGVFALARAIEAAHGIK